MTDKEIIKAFKEIIKALECCSEGIREGYCLLECPRYPRNTYCKSDEVCKSELIEETLALINRQQAEIERLNNNISAMAITMRTSAKATEAEAVKEFAERLKMLNNSNLIIWNEQIDNLVKEMVG